jgi:hypothetical protein
MKLILSLLILLSILPDRSLAIPQTVGGGFLNAAGMRFEEFAAARETWLPGAELKGRWLARARKPGAAEGAETLDLAMDAEVFGIPASQVSAERIGGTVRRFVVRFDESKTKTPGKARGGDLFARVTTNLQAAVGEPQAKSPGGEMTFRHEASVIVARRAGAREVLIEFTPAR